MELRNPDYRAATAAIFAAARGEELRARAEVIKAGRRLVVAEASVYTQQAGAEQLVARALVTLAVLPRAAKNSEDHPQG